MFDFIWVPLLWYFAAAAMTPKPKVENSPLRATQEATLTCTVPILCSANITWTWRCAGGNASCIQGNMTNTKTENLTGIAPRHESSPVHDKVQCKVSFSGGSTANETKTLNVSLFLSILKTSECELESDLPTCMCISLECLSSSGPHEERQNLTITNFQVEDLLSKVLRTFKQVEVIIALLIGFLLGIIFTSFVTCLAIKCQRQKVKPGSAMEDVEMVNSLAVETYVGHAADEEGIHDQDEAEVEVEPAGSSAPEGDVRPKEVEYSHIDFSILKTKNPAEEELTKESPETEYAEIKKETREQGEGNEGEGMEKTEEMKKNVETEDGVQAEGGGEEEVALYSNVKEIMDEV